MATTPEGRVKRRVKQLLKQYGVWYFMPVPCGYGTAGIPDFVCCYRGLFFGIETKAPGRKSAVTPRQKQCHEAIRKAGGHVFVIDNADDICNIIESLSGAGRETGKERKQAGAADPPTG